MVHVPQIRRRRRRHAAYTRSREAPAWEPEEDDSHLPQGVGAMMIVIAASIILLVVVVLGWPPVTQ